MGASGRIFMSGTVGEMEIARDRIIDVLNKIKGRTP
jgi:hypothetical protein